MSGKEDTNRNRIQSTILLEILAALGVILVVSVSVSFLLQARLTRAALEGQSRRLTAAQLTLLTEGYEDREQALATFLRSVAERLDAGGLTRPERRNALIADLSITSTSLRMNILQTIGPTGEVVSGSSRIIDPAELSVVRRTQRTGKSALVETVGGRKVQALSIAIGTTGFVLVGGYDFAGSFAYDMRKKIGSAGQIILIAEGELVGSTLPTPPQGIPGKPKNSDQLPSAPTLAPFGEGQALVAYVSIGDSVPTTAGALGVVLGDPTADLNLALARGRLSSNVFLGVVALGLGWFLFRRIIRPLVGLSSTAGRIALGDLSADFTAPRQDEIGRLARSLQLMTSELQAKTRNLQEASKRLIGAQEQERRRVARDLHDGMQQQLVALAVKLRRASSSPEGATGHCLAQLADDAENAAFALQELGRGISPTVLADQGLQAALRAAAGRLPMKVTLTVQQDLEDARFSPDIEGTVYYVALEAMNNAQKHAAEATLAIELAMEEMCLVLRVSDDGPGFDVEEAKKADGAGLQNMQDRINAEGGTVMLKSQPGAGTSMVCLVPLVAAN